MKQLLSLLLCTILTVTAFGQSEPITTLQGQNGTKFASPKLVVPSQQATKTPLGGLIETGNNNLLANPSFEHSIIGTGWTFINGSCGASSGVTVDGLKNCLFTSSGTNWSASQCSTTNAARLAGQEMENSVWIGSASTTDPIWVCPGTNGSYPTPSVANGCMQYTNIGNIQLLKNYFLGDSASTSNCIRISGSNSGTTVGIDKAYSGLRTNSEVSGELNTPWQSCGLTTSDFQGFGTVSSIELQCKRSGPDLLMRGAFTSGTSTGAEARINLKLNGTNLTSSGASYIPSIQRAGAFDFGVTSSNNGVILIDSNVPYINMGLQSGTFAGLSKASGSSIALSGVRVSINARIPISGWENNINAFSLKCDDPRQCETVFSAKVSSTGIVSDESTDWINGSCTTSAGSQNFATTCNFNSDIFKISPNCSFSIKKEFPWTGGVQSVTSTSIAYTVSNGVSGSSGVDAYLVCQKAGSDYLNSRITQQIVQMRGVPRTPGAVRTDIFGVRYTGGSATTACSTVGACTLLNPIGNGITSIAKTGTGNYLVTFSKNYINVSCTYTPTGAAYLGGQVNGFTSGTNTLSIQSGISGGSVQDSFGTINCIGEY